MKEDVRVHPKDKEGVEQGPVTGAQAPSESYAPEALYKEGMAYYRRRRWREAKDCFERVRTLQPNRRGVAALLRELEIFLQLESVEADTAEERPVREIPLGAALEAEERETAPGRGWLTALLVVVASALLVGATYLYILWQQNELPFLPNNQRIERLQNRGMSLIQAGRWAEALNVYAELAEIIPDDPEAAFGLIKSQERLYEETLAEERRADALDALDKKAEIIDSVLERWQRIADVDPGYKDVSQRIDHLRSLKTVIELHGKAREYMEDQAYGKAIEKLHDIRVLDSTYRPGTITDEVYAAYMGKGLRYMELAAAELKPVSNVKPSEPQYAVGEDMLGNVREAIKAFDKAIQERPDSEEAKLAKLLAGYLHEGLERYTDWAWRESIASLAKIYEQNPSYLLGRAAAVLCDAYLHLGDFYQQNGDYEVALGQFQAMAEIEECDVEVARTRAYQAGIPLTPTATPTLTPTSTPTNTPTNTPRPTLTATPIPTSTPTWTPVPTATKSTGGPSPKPTKPPRPPRR